MRDKKVIKEASKTFQAIMTTKIPPKKYDPEPCPKCGMNGDHIPPVEKDGRNLVVQFKCPTGHRYSKYIMIKK